MKKQDEKKHPFFANLLDVQQKTKEDQESLGITKPWLDQAQTQKWPSDGDDDIPPIEF